MNRENPEILEQYFGLLEERTRLAQAAEEATEFVRPMLQDTLETADQSLEDLRRDPELVDGLRMYGETISKTLMQLDELEHGDFSLLSEEEIHAKRTEFLADPRVEHVLGIASIAVADAVEVVAHDTDETGAALSVPRPEAHEAEPHFPDIKITIRGDGVQIGQRGKFVRLSGATSKDQTDYSEQRLAALRVLVEQAGEEVRVKDLWDLTFPDKEFDQRTMTQIRVWLENLTYRSSPIVVHNGVRGNASAYCIPNTNVELVESKTTVPTSKTAEAPRGEEFVVDGTKKAQREGEPSTSTPDTVAEQEIEEKEEQAPVYFPLGRAESILLAEFLNHHKRELQAVGIPVLPEKVVKTLTANIEQARIIQEFQARFKDLTEARRAIVTSINEYFEQDEKVLNDMDAMKEKDMRYGLFDYLTQFEADDREWIVSQLIDAEPFIEINIHGGTFSTGQQVMGARTGTRLPNGETIEAGKVVSSTEEETGQQIPVEAEPLEADSETEPEPSVDEGTPPSTEETEEVQVEDTAAPETNPQTAEKEEPEWLVSLREDIQAQIQDFVEQGVMQPGTISRKNLGRMTNSRKIGTEESEKRALGNGIIRKSEQGADTELDICTHVLIAVQNSHPEAFNTKSRQKKAVKLAKELVQAHFERVGVKA